jgi:hypothetical protein
MAARLAYRRRSSTGRSEPNRSAAGSGVIATLWRVSMQKARGPALRSHGMPARTVRATANGCPGEAHPISAHVHLGCWLIAHRGRRRSDGTRRTRRRRSWDRLRVVVRDRRTHVRPRSRCGPRRSRRDSQSASGRNRAVVATGTRHRAALCAMVTKTRRRRVRSDGAAATAAALSPRHRESCLGGILGSIDEIRISRRS